MIQSAKDAGILYSATYSAGERGPARNPRLVHILKNAIGEKLSSRWIALGEKGTTAAFFDVDGTLIRGFVLGGFPKYLADHGIVSQADLDRTSRIMDEARRSLDRVSSLELVWVTFGMNIRGLKQEVILDASKDFMKEYLPTVIRSYTMSLLAEVRSCGSDGDYWGTDSEMYERAQALGI